MKARLQTGESSLAAASANLEDLRKQLALQEKTLLQNAEDLKRKQAKVEIESAEVLKEKAQRAAAEQSAQELSAKALLLTEQCAKLEALFTKENTLASETATRLVAVEAELEAGKRRVEELTEQAVRLTSESVELKRASEQETRFRTALEAQLNTDQERISQLTNEIAELQNERVQLEMKLNEERGSAAKGMELLLMAQEKLSSVFKPVVAESQNGDRAPVPVEAVASPDGHQK